MQPSLSKTLTVAELLKQYPQAVPVFLQHRMSCVGCSMSLFETLQDAAAIYHVPFDSFILELQGAIDQGSHPQPSGE